MPEQPKADAGVEQPQQEQPAGQKMVPHEAFHAEKQKVKRYTEEVAEFRRSNESLQRQVSELLQRVPVPEKAAPQPVNPWDDLEGAISQRSQAAVSPLLQQFDALQTQVARLSAERVFGDRYEEFMSYLKDATSRGDPEVRLLSAMMDASPDPYGTAKKWFDAKTFDVEAEVEKRLAAKLAETQSQQPPAPSAPVMPSNLAGARNVGTRSGPVWAGPTPLQDIFKR